MDFIQKLDEMIKFYDNEKENESHGSGMRLVFRMFTAELKVLRKKYFDEEV